MRIKTLFRPNWLPSPNWFPLVAVLTVLVTCITSATFSTATHAARSVLAVALFEGRAMLSIDGQKAKIYKAGDVVGDVKLVSSNTSQAIIEVSGQRQVLVLNGTAILSKSLGATPLNGGPARIEISVNSAGFFEVDGSVEGEDIRFLVDTGANLVVLSSVDAERVDLEYTQGVRTVATTASGRAPMYLVLVDDLEISDGLASIELDDIQVGVIEGNYPTTPLLGMSFLSRVQMQRNGDTMVLEPR